MKRSVPNPARNKQRGLALFSEAAFVAVLSAGALQASMPSAMMASSHDMSRSALSAGSAVIAIRPLDLDRIALSDFGD